MRDIPHAHIEIDNLILSSRKPLGGFIEPMPSISAIPWIPDNFIRECIENERLLPEGQTISAYKTHGEDGFTNES